MPIRPTEEYTESSSGPYIWRVEVETVETASEEWTAKRVDYQSSAMVVSTKEFPLHASIDTPALAVGDRVWAIWCRDAQRWEVFSGYGHATRIRGKLTAACAGVAFTMDNLIGLNGAIADGVTSLVGCANPFSMEGDDEGDVSVEWNQQSEEWEAYQMLCPA